MTLARSYAELMAERLSTSSSDQPVILPVHSPDEDAKPHSWTSSMV